MEIPNQFEQELAAELIRRIRERNFWSDMRMSIDEASGLVAQALAEQRRFGREDEHE